MTTQAAMEVYLVPVGRDAYEPYCEVDDADAQEITAADAGRSWWGRLHERFRAMLAAAEVERVRAANGEHDDEPGWTGRLRRRALRWIAERIAEQRLLWHLRRQHDVTLVFPADLTAERADDVLRGALQRDADRHFRWLLVDGALLALSSVLTLIPGPNVLWWYFAFRVVGHLFSWRGARHGLSRVRWRPRPSDALADLRHAFRLQAHERERHVTDVASRLRLQHLARFFERMALWGA